MKVTFKPRREIREVHDIAVTTDEDYPDKVEIHLLDQDGVIIEGGQFDLGLFILHVMEFYHKHY
jgi:hypothetical protein